MSFSSLSIISVSCVSDVWICKYRGSRRALKIFSKCQEVFAVLTKNIKDRYGEYHTEKVL